MCRSHFFPLQVPTTGPSAQPRPPPLVAVPPIVQSPPATWSPATDLIVGDDRKLHQSLQHPDIKLCISEAVNRSNAKLFFEDAFPDLKTKNSWLTESLAKELTNRSETNLFLREVNTRAKKDSVYFEHLVSMVCELCMICDTVVKKLFVASRSVELCSPGYHHSSERIHTVSAART